MRSKPADFSGFGLVVSYAILSMNWIIERCVISMKKMDNDFGNKRKWSSFALLFFEEALILNFLDTSR